MRLDAVFERLERRLEEATPGPWRTSGHDPAVYGRRDAGRKGGAGLVAKAAERWMDRAERLANAALIADAATALPALIGVAKAAREAKEIWNERLFSIDHDRLLKALQDLETAFDQLKEVFNEA